MEENSNVDIELETALEFVSVCIVVILCSKVNSEDRSWDVIVDVSNVEISAEKLLDH